MRRERNDRRLHFAIGVWCAFFAAAAPLAAEDTIYLSTKASGGTSGTLAMRGTITEYDGKLIRLKTSDGRELTYPSDRVKAIDTTYSEAQLAGDQLFAAFKFREAHEKYAEALQGAEDRAWVRRQLMARQVWCFRQMNQTAFAVRMFIALVEQDAETPYFDCIPLAWMTEQSAALPEHEAAAWMANDQPAAQLIGASYLLSGQQAAAARTKLQQLAKLRHPMMPWLAEAQLWRAKYVSSTKADLESWSRLVEKMPATLQAGPSHVLGQAWEHHKEPENAAIWYLHGPVLDARDRRLAAASLERGARALEQNQWPCDAAQIYGEIVRTYADQTEIHRRASERFAATPADCAAE